MPPAKPTYPFPSDGPNAVLKEDGIESGLIGRLQGLKYDYRPDITNRATLEKNFREKFEALNRVRLTDAEFARLLDEIVTPDVFTASKTLRAMNSFTRDDGTPLNYTLVNIKDWCKNTFEVINQLRINTDNSHHRYDVILLINGVPCVQIELKTLGVNPRRAMEQIVEYKNDPGNGYTRANTSVLGLTSFIIMNSSFDIPQRPYQVYAVQHMVKCIDDDNGNGFVWHTTGSGKTLTSFKASTLLKENDHIHICVFVVDLEFLFPA